MVDSIKYGRQVQKQHNDNVLIVHCTQDIILYTDKGHLDTVIWLIRRLLVWTYMYNPTVKLLHNKFVLSLSYVHTKNSYFKHSFKTKMFHGINQPRNERGYLWYFNRIFWTCSKMHTLHLHDIDDKNGNSFLLILQMFSSRCLENIHIYISIIYLWSLFLSFWYILVQKLAKLTK